MAKKKSNTISAAELEAIKLICEHYHFSFGKLNYGVEFYEAFCRGKNRNFLWNQMIGSFSNFLDELRAFFEAEGAANSMESFKSRFKEFINDDED